MTGDLAASVSEDDASTAGSLTIVNPPSGNGNFEVRSGVDGVYGTFSLTAVGGWTYTVNRDAANALSAGAGPVEVFTVVAAGDAQTTTAVSITVNGENDAPVASASARPPDADAGQTVTLDGSGSLDPEGEELRFSWMQTDGAVVTLSDGAIESTTTFMAPDDLSGGLLVFTLTVTDLQGATDTATVAVRVRASPMIGPERALTGEVVEDAVQTTATGTLSIINLPDGASTGFEVQDDVPGTYGTFGIEMDGLWTYTLNNNDENTNALGQGVRVNEEAFTVTAAGVDISAAVAITVIGANDTPTATFTAQVDGGCPWWRATRWRAARRWRWTGAAAPTWTPERRRRWSMSGARWTGGAVQTRTGSTMRRWR